MRAVFGVLSLLVVVAVIGVLVKKQMATTVAPAGGPAPTVQGVAAPTGTPQQQVQQVQKAVEGAMQQPRPMPDEPK